jgi:hypothetical protein
MPGFGPGGVDEALTLVGELADELVGIAATVAKPGDAARAANARAVTRRSFVATEMIQSYVR